MNKRRKRNKNRKRIIAVLILLSLIITSGTFAYWANYVEGTQADAVGTLSVGSAEAVRTRFDLSNEFHSGGHLVPFMQVANSQEADAVESIILSHDIQWVEDEEISQLEGTRSEGYVRVWHYITIKNEGVLLPYDGNENIYALVNVSYNVNNKEVMVLDGTVETFSYEVTLTEPANQAEYDLIANAEISLFFNYQISDKDITSEDLNGSNDGVIDVDGEQLPVNSNDVTEEENSDNTTEEEANDSNDNQGSIISNAQIIFNFSEYESGWEALEKLGYTDLEIHIFLGLAMEIQDGDMLYDFYMNYTGSRSASNKIVQKLEKAGTITVIRPNELV